MALHGHFNHYAHFSLMPISCPHSPTHIHTHFFILTETLPSLPNKPNYSITFTKPVIIPPTYHFSHYLTFILPIPITHPHLHPFLQSLSPAYHHFFKTPCRPSILSLEHMSLNSLPVLHGSSLVAHYYSYDLPFSESPRRLWLRDYLIPYCDPWQP